MHRGPKAGRTTRKCYGTFQILRANRGLKAGRKTRKRFGDFPTLCKIRWDSFDEFVSFWPAIVCYIGGLGVLANRGPKAGRKTRKRFGDFPIFRNIRLASFDEFVTLGFHVFVLLVELGVFVNCGPPGRVLGWVASGLGFLSAVPGIDLFCNSLTGSPGVGC